MKRLLSRLVRHGAHHPHDQLGGPPRLTAALISILLVAGCAGSSPPMPLTVANGEAKIRAVPGTRVVCIGEVSRCIIPVYVLNVGTQDCKAYATVETIEVQAPAHAFPPDGKIRVVWELRPGTADERLADYGFDTASGIAQTNVTIGTPFDLKESDEGAALRPKRFRWRSNHSGASAEVHYAPIVYRYTNGDRKPCEAPDPIIKNTS